MRQFFLTVGLIASCSNNVSATESKFSEQDIRDATCLAVFLAATGQARSGNDDKMVQSLGAVTNYFRGKLIGRHPDLKFRDIVTPDLAIRAFQADTETKNKCGREILALDANSNDAATSLRDAISK